MHCVILSGGSGTRLWPLSREAHPKQFHALASGESMLAETVIRALALDGPPRLLAITSEAHRFFVASVLQAVSGGQSAGIILEPVGRNTAPAIALAALAVAAERPDELMLVMPSDHVIQDVEAFRSAVEAGANAARAGKLVTFGVSPDSPHTGYGYIESVSDGRPWQPVTGFVEKPDLATAWSYLESGRYYWNSGLFLFRADRYLEELGRFRADILDACREAFGKREADLDFLRVGAAGFARCPSESVDYAVMEHTTDAVMVPLDAGWSDVGGWSALWNIHGKDGDNNVLRGDVLTEDVSGSYIHSEGRLVAVLGVSDQIIVETGDAILVAGRHRVDEVRTLVDQLKASNREEVRFHKKVHRPWGTYERIAAGDRFQVKRITVSPGASLSLQKHHHRAEHWVVVRGTAEVTRGDDCVTLTEDQSTYIPLGVRHRLHNPGVIPLELIEVQTGSYLGEDDIIRFEDRYKRP